MSTSSGSDWPPRDARAFVGGERFASELLAVAGELQARYEAMDFVGAVGLVWDWFARKARRSPRWFAGRHPRFETVGQLRAYLRQALWRTAANEARRDRRRRRIAPLPLDMEPVALASGSAERLEWRDAAEALPVPLNLILIRVVFDEQDVGTVARELGISVRQVADLFEVAVDRLAHADSERFSKMAKTPKRRPAPPYVLWNAVSAALAPAPRTCEDRCRAKGLTDLQARLVCEIVVGGRDPTIVASESEIDIAQLNREYGEALVRLAGR